MIGKTNVSSCGATLEVSGVAGNTVSISKDSKTKTKTFDTNGKARFVGLSDGIWVITMTDGEQTATSKQEIKTKYSASVEFFAAKIIVSFPSGIVCKCSNGKVTYTSDTSGHCVFNIPTPGNWTISYILNEDEDTEEIVSYVVVVSKNGEAIITPTSGILYDAGTFTEGFEKNIVTSGLTATVTEQADYIRIDNSKGTNGGYICIGPVYFGGIIHADVSSATNYNVFMEIGISAQNDTTTWDATAQQNVAKNAAAELILDTSAYSGRGYIYVGASLSGAGSARTNAKIKKIWVE